MLEQIIFLSMVKHLRSLLLFVSLLCSLSFMAQEPQKLYWVGGSGNFNDAAHWSLHSGGVGGVKIPSISDDVYFDENSFIVESVINFVGKAEVNAFVFSPYTPKVIFEGQQRDRITINGELKLNAFIDNHFAGDIWLTSSQQNTSVYFSAAQIKGNIYFKGKTNWAFEGNLLAADDATVYFSRGTFNLTNTAIYSGNLIANAGVTINTNQSTFRISNKFILPDGLFLMIPSRLLKLT